MASGPSRLGSGVRMSGISGGVPRGLPTAEHGGSGREVGSGGWVGRKLCRNAGKRRHRLAPAHRSGRELGPTPPTIKLEKDVEGIVDEAEEEPLSVLCLSEFLPLFVQGFGVFIEEV